MAVREVLHGRREENVLWDHPQYVYEIDEVHYDHTYQCPHWEDEEQGVMHDDCGPDCHVEIQGVEIAYAGTVLNEWEVNGYSDSDWKVSVFDVVEQKVKHYEYATTRAYTYGNNAKIDATPEIIAAAIEATLPLVAEGWRKENVRQCKEVEIGREVKVLGGRKHKDKVGVVRWKGPNPYSHSKYDVRVRLETAEGESFFMDEDRVVVVEQERYLKGEADLAAHLEIARRNMVYKWGKPAEQVTVWLVAPQDVEF